MTNAMGTINIHSYSTLQPLLGARYSRGGENLEMSFLTLYCIKYMYPSTINVSSLVTAIIGQKYDIIQPDDLFFPIPGYTSSHITMRNSDDLELHVLPNQACTYSNCTTGYRQTDSGYSIALCAF